MVKLTRAQILLSIEGDLSLPAGFLDGLPALDDWTFVVKCHALLETVMTECLSMELNPELRDCIAFMTAKSKREFVAALKLIDPERILFLQVFASLRNFFVHDVKQVAASIKDYAEGGSKDRRNAFRRACWVGIGLRESETTIPPDLRTKISEMVKEDPKVMLWGSAIDVVFALNAVRVKAKVRRTPPNLVRLRDLLIATAEGGSSASVKGSVRSPFDPPSPPEAPE